MITAMKKLIIPCLLLVAGYAFAEDLIVLRNGDIVKAIVSDITPTEIKYKKASNPNGPSYTVNKADVLSINYENGDKDVFDSAPVAEPQPAQSSGPVFVEPKPSADNESRIAAINNADVHTVKNTPSTDKLKTVKEFFPVLGITPGSILSDDNLEITFEFNEEYHTILDNYFDVTYDVPNSKWWNPTYRIVLTNKTGRILYVDVANSFRIDKEGKAESFVSGVVISHTTGSGSGMGVNLGAVAGALGVGGAVGTLASGIGIGGGRSSSTTITETESDILTIPPHGRIVMPQKLYSNSKKTKTTKNYEILRCTPGRYDVVKKGEVEKWAYLPVREPDYEHGMRYSITYSTMPDFAKYTSLPFGFYVKGIVGYSFGAFKSRLDLVSDPEPLMIGPAQSVPKDMK